MRWSNLCSGLAVRRNGRSKRTCEAHLIHRLKGKYVRSPANIEGFADERCEHRSISEIMASMKMASMVMDPVTAPCSAP